MRRRQIAIVCAALALGLASSASGAKSKATPAQKCAAAKVKAMSRKTASLFACHWKALGRGATVDPTCLARAAAKFTVAFAKIDARGGCIVTGDAAAVEGEIDAAVAALVATAPTEPTTTSTSTSTSTSTAVPTTTLPSCPIEGMPCGSCAEGGICVRHCPGATLVCASDSVGTIANCNADAACMPGQYCVANGPQCGTGMLNACAALCP